MWIGLVPRRPAQLPRRRVRPIAFALEPRVTPSTYRDVFTPMMVAGDATGSPADSPSARVDSNSITSYFTGVGSVQTSARRGTYIGTGTLLTDTDTNSTYVLTAGHVVDINNDGKFDKKDGVTSLTFWFNIGGDKTSSLSVAGTAVYSSVFVNPNYTGFGRPSVNDDLAVIKFNGVLPANAYSYSVYSGDVYHHVLTMVGYGRSGYGDVGYTTGASWSIKRVGQNVVDAFYGQDDGGQSGANEVFRFDFDGPNGSTNTFGDNGSINDGLTLGNDVETTIGGGDSGGPSFVWIDGVPYVAGVNTFTQGASAPLFGSLGGGIAVPAYVAWLKSVVPGLPDTGGTLSTAPGGIPGTGDQASLRLPETIPADNSSPVTTDDLLIAPPVVVELPTVQPTGPRADPATPAGVQPPQEESLPSGARPACTRTTVIATGPLTGLTTFVDWSAESGQHSMPSGQQSAVHGDASLPSASSTSTPVNAQGIGQSNLNTIDLIAPIEVTAQVLSWLPSDSPRSLFMLSGLAVFMNGGGYVATPNQRQSLDCSKANRRVSS